MNSKDVNFMRRAGWIGSGLVLALVLMGFSCGKGLKFSHQQHVDKQGLECKDCHAGSPDGLQAGAPDPKYCLNCHEEASQYEALAKKLAPKWPRLKALPPDGTFSHQTHQDAGITCEQCHGDMKHNKKVTPANLPTMETCLKCHKDMGVGTGCAVCHKTLSEKSPPPDHNRDWKRFHGSAAQEPVRGGRCYLCHERSYCSTCHSIEKPRDHGTNTWLNFGHGVAAGVDRTRCSTCHHSDFCIQCHQESPPVSHQPGWGPPLDRHCLACHLTVTVSNCSVCHSGRVPHLNAPTRPNTPPHTTPTDCRACHHGFLMPHPDNGDNCQICHKRG
jgi:hypothetical protein